MTADMTFVVFSDFNDHSDDPPPPPPAEDDSLASDELDRIREAAWTDGYLAGRQEPGNDPGDAKLTAKLLTSLDELEASAADVVHTASLAVADLLINTVAAVLTDDWPAKLLGRARIIADRIKPALMMAPEFVLRDDGGTERHFADIASLSRALDSGIVGEGVTIRWQRGEATISRTTLLEDLREAVIPLSAGLVNEPTLRCPS